jgi:hypothetical protein
VHLHLGDLKKIVLGRWTDFRSYVDADNRGKEKFADSVDVVIRIRNRVMHPARTLYEPVTESEIELLSAFSDLIRSARRLVR